MSTERARNYVTFPDKWQEGDVADLNVLNDKRVKIVLKPLV